MDDKGLGGMICCVMLRFERERVIDGFSVDTARSEPTERDREESMFFVKV